MDVKYINPFIEGCQDIIGKVAGFNVAPGTISVKKSPYTEDNIVVIIGLTGQIRGTAIFSFRMAVACRIASAMMGMTVNELDEMGKSAISELSNMIMGKSATIFSDRGDKVDISPPTVLMGDNMQFSADNAKIVSIPLLFDSGDQITLDISFVEM
ncbi:chemotaxis protein CheX [Hydrogenispora ethanolica]|uniref:Chemotaxis protein CheX n=1 Tax=Hydrogenispora ethanolica TaxID=1082276 RepID=A0A4R1S2Y5_HYDET|nr:chemotaxis protein CheX [Hydrogenispora ethanolica]TCL73274.1 chemotaxis protein CheX [Hydrogenispora ethanolica]